MEPKYRVLNLHAELVSTPELCKGMIVQGNLRRILRKLCLVAAKSSSRFGKFGSWRDRDCSRNMWLYKSDDSLRLMRGVLLHRGESFLLSPVSYLHG